MPRPKVKPQDRQRSARACDACKASKKRCDANEPCLLCIRKGTQDSCTFTPSPRDRRSLRSSSRATSLTAARPAPTRVVPTNVSSAVTRSTQRPEPQFSNRPVVPRPAQLDSGDEDLETDTEGTGDYRDSTGKVPQRPVMLDSSTGDKGRLPASNVTSFGL